MTTEAKQAAIIAIALYLIYDVAFSLVSDTVLYVASLVVMVAYAGLAGWAFYSYREPEKPSTVRARTSTHRRA
jgi:hypothetical protein